VETVEESIARRKTDIDSLKTQHLFSAIRNDDLEELKIAIASGASLSKPHEWKIPPIQFAKIFRHKRIIDYLNKALNGR
jgi:hypothetical protein